MKKHFGIGLFILIVIFSVEIFSQSHNMEWGFHQPGDKRLFRKIAIKEYSFMKIVTDDVFYNGTENITYIKATDQYINGNGGYATLLTGGIGFKEVSLHLKSQRNHGINFIIEIYGE